MHQIRTGRGGRAATFAALAALLVGAAACSSSASKTAKAKQPPTPSATPRTTASPSGGPTSAAPTPSGKTSTAQPAPSGLATVPPVPVRTQRPVPPASVATFGGGVSARITKVASVTSQGTGPGELRGAPAVAMTLTITNGTARGLSLETVAVSATYGADQTPASPSAGPPSAPFHGAAVAGASASGVYVFVIPTNARGNVSVSISYTASQPTVFFQGSLG